MIHTLLIMLSALFSGGSFDVAQSATPTVFKVLKVEGSVLTRAATSARWYQVREGRFLPEGQLIQVTANASITVENRYNLKAAGVGADRLQLTLTKPIVTRLSSDLLREVKLSTFFVDQVNAVAPPTAEIFPPPLTLKEAWTKLVAMVSNIPPPDLPQISLAELERQGMALGASAKRIRLFAPTANSVVQSAEWPLEVKMVWDNPKRAPMKFYIYTWPSNSPRPAPVAATRQDFHSIKIPRPGTYFVQVMSDDGIWQSDAVAIHALVPLDQNVAAGGVNASELKSKAALTLRYPPDQFVVASQRSPLAMTVSWNFETSGPNPFFEASVKDSLGKLVRVIKTKATEASINLDPGRYVWSVAVVGTNFRTTNRQFEILRPEESSSTIRRRQLVRRLISTGHDLTVILDEGI